LDDAAMKIGDLVRMTSHETGLVGIVLDIMPHNTNKKTRQIGIQWLTAGFPFDWEPEGWLEVVSENRR
tara:strand:+ start:3493 stop:3696 length:204 start_codon:yes stop_codon:yes gene_type:complete